MASPQLIPSPCTIFKTPSGKPACLQILPNKKEVTGVTSLGFAITQLPAAKAGAIFHVNKYKGKFHGLMQPTIPIGWRKV